MGAMARTRRARAMPKDDRRRHQRFALSVGLAYKVRRLPPPKRMVTLLDTLRAGKTRNISRAGMCMKSSQLLLPGTIMDVTVPKSPATRGGRRRARVIWIREDAPNLYQIGIRFV